MPDNRLNMQFSNLHFDGQISSRWDVLLRVVGDFELSVADRSIYREVDFCLVEFALAVGRWLLVANDGAPDFAYTSVESEIAGLIKFESVHPGLWRVSAAHQIEASPDLVATAELKEASLSYIRELRAALLPTTDILAYVDDPNLQSELGAKLS